MKSLSDKKSKTKNIILLLSLLFLFAACNNIEKTANSCISVNGLHKLEYNNPGLLVDLDAGFKDIPMPMDFDGDGDYDLLISESGAYAEAGVYYFENISGNIDEPVFRYGMRVSTERRRLSYDGACFEVSNINGHVHVLTPDKVSKKLLIYKNVPQNVFWDDNEIKLSPKGMDILHTNKYSYWKIIDFNGDDTYDLLCAARDIFFLKNIGTNEKPKYSNPKIINDVNGNSLTKNSYRSPLFADFDNDGDYDYIGMKNSGFVYFENIGDNGKYKFEQAKEITYNNKLILTECRATIYPTAIDFNDDGNIDIIFGDEDGKVSFMKNTGKLVNGIPQFLPPVFFKQKAKFVDFGALTTPRIFDWDGDGLDDIISGNGVGHIGFIKNLGGYCPKWDAPKLLKADDKPIRILPKGASWGYTTIDVGYWDEDDLPDILVNDHNGNVVWFKNIGTRTNPKLAKAKPIEVQWKGKPQKPAWVPGKSEGNELLAPWRTSPFIMDFNNDGLNDLVMLDYQGYLSVFLRYKEDGKLLLVQPERNFVYPSGEPIQLNQLKGSHSGRLKITFADWDGDGLEDLIFSSKPAVDWMKNLGMKDGKMILQYMGRVLSRRLMGHTDGPVVSDFNKDGIPDLLVGTETGVFYYWKRPSFDITTTMTTTGKQTPANYKYFKR